MWQEKAWASKYRQIADRLTLASQYGAQKPIRYKEMAYNHQLIPWQIIPSFSSLDPWRTWPLCSQCDALSNQPWRCSEPFSKSLYTVERCQSSHNSVTMGRAARSSECWITLRCLYLINVPQRSMLLFSIVGSYPNLCSIWWKWQACIIWSLSVLQEHESCKPEKLLEKRQRIRPLAEFVALYSAFRCVYAGSSQRKWAIHRCRGATENRRIDQCLGVSRREDWGAILSLVLPRWNTTWSHPTVCNY